MTYYLDIFSPETYEGFAASDRLVTGFKPRYRQRAEQVRTGDRFICYLTKLSRWVGVLEVVDGPFDDASPRHLASSDPYIVRFHVEPKAWLEMGFGLPIHEDEIWSSLSFTRGQDKEGSAWTGKFRSSLNALSDSDGRFLDAAIRRQVEKHHHYPFDQAILRSATTRVVHRSDRVVAVSIPEEEKGGEPTEPTRPTRESIRMQALLVRIGARMDLRLWVPRQDRGAVLAEYPQASEVLLDRLPLNYDDTTLKTIEQIDVLWMKGRSIVRAFEVEHTTAVYSGILRMADLLALQPNMQISLHIVAPSDRREKVFSELRRPVFSLLDRGPLAESCTFLSYESVLEISELKHLEHLSDSVLEDYAEEPE